MRFGRRSRCHFRRSARVGCRSCAHRARRLRHPGRARGSTIVVLREGGTHTSAYPCCTMVHIRFLTFAFCSGDHCPPSCLPAHVLCERDLAFLAHCHHCTNTCSRNRYSLDLGRSHPLLSRTQSGFGQTGPTSVRTASTWSKPTQLGRSHLHFGLHRPRLAKIAPQIWSEPFRLRR